MAEKTIIIINLILQCVLIVAVLTAGYLAKIRHQFKAHCLMLRIAIPVQVAAIGAIMLPAMLGYIQRGNRTPFFNAAMLVHHILGLAVVALWVYINLVFQGTIKGFGELKIAMRSTFFLWIIVLLMGIYLYLVTWVL
jgi:hypothetical protein